IYFNLLTQIKFIYLNRIDNEGKTLTKHAFCSFNYKTLL
ncbi:hypothetical protein M138_4938, partial [Bacteroides fragilis str. S23L17]